MDIKIKDMVCTVIPAYKSTLDYFEKREQLYGVDSIEFNKSQIQETLRSMNISDVNTLRSIISAMKKYISMYKTFNGAIPDNNYDSLTTEDYEACVKNTRSSVLVFNRKDILEFCSQLDEEYQYLLLGLYEGIGAKHLMDIAELRIENVKKDKNGYHVDLISGGVIDISEDLVKVIATCYRKYGLDGLVLSLEGKRGKPTIDEDTMYYKYKRMKELTRCEQLSIPKIKLAGLAERFNKISEGVTINRPTDFQNIDGIKELFEMYGYSANTYRAMYKTLKPYL